MDFLILLVWHNSAVENRDHGGLLSRAIELITEVQNLNLIIFFNTSVAISTRNSMSENEEEERSPYDFLKRINEEIEKILPKVLLHHLCGLLGYEFDEGKFKEYHAYNLEAETYRDIWELRTKKYGNVIKLLQVNRAYSIKKDTKKLKIRLLLNKWCNNLNFNTLSIIILFYKMPFFTLNNMVKLKGMRY